MNRLQTSPLGKAAAWVLLLLFSFGSFYFGFQAILALSCSGLGSWQDSSAFRNLIQNYEIRLTQYFAGKRSLEEDSPSYMIRQQLESDIREIEADLTPASTPFRYQIRSSDGAAILESNLAEGEELSQKAEKIYYSVLQKGDSTPEAQAQWDRNYAIDGYTLYSNMLGSFYEPVSATKDTLDPQSSPYYIMECGVPLQPDGQMSDAFSMLYAQISAFQVNLNSWSALSLGLLLAALLCLSFILWASGRRLGTEGPVLSWQDRIFFDLYFFTALCAGTALFAGMLALGENLYYLYVHSYSSVLPSELILIYSSIALLGSVFMAVIALTLRTFAVRCKAHALARTTLTARVILWLYRGSRDLVLSLPFTWRVIAAYVLYFFLNLLLFTQSMYDGIYMLFYLTFNLIVLILLCWWTMAFRRLRKGSEAIAAGNLTHQIDTHRMPLDLRRHAEALNNISVGLASAVDEKMRSERFKAELITNVSHDLKTPLTSIINYVNLLKTTDQADPKAQEYIEVLDRKSLRLKKLTEDLVEASKASTGVLSVNREKISMGQLIDQALGEWTEKLEERKLTVVSSIPEGETWVYADGRHLWRVIDNLLSNCAKYAMEGTRIYLDLTRGKGQVALSVKNISRDALNIPPERLMERFVRGDESRTTEGSGLGLSIARSLTELQGGTFDLTVDGDLFKATVTMPQAN